MHHARDHDLDEGFSLIEVVVAMLLFALISVALLPLAISAVQLSVVNRDQVAANTFASAQLQAVRADFGDDAENSCTAVRALAGTGLPDPAGTGLAADLTVSACPAAYPDVVTVTAAVRDDPAAEAVVTMTTQIVVTAS